MIDHCGDTVTQTVIDPSKKHDTSVNKILQN